MKLKLLLQKHRLQKKKLLNKFRLIQQTNKKSLSAFRRRAFCVLPEPDPNRQSQIEVYSSFQDLDNQGEENFQG